MNGFYFHQNSEPYAYVACVFVLHTDTLSDINSCLLVTSQNALAPALSFAEKLGGGSVSHFIVKRTTPRLSDYLIHLWQSFVGLIFSYPLFSSYAIPVLDIVIHITCILTILSHVLVHGPAK